MSVYDRVIFRDLTPGLQKTCANRGKLPKPLFVLSDTYTYSMPTAVLLFKRGKSIMWNKLIVILLLPVFPALRLYCVEDKDNGGPIHYTKNTTHLHLPPLSVCEMMRRAGRLRLDPGVWAERQRDRQRLKKRSHAELNTQQRPAFHPAKGLKPDFQWEIEHKFVKTLVVISSLIIRIAEANLTITSASCPRGRWAAEWAKAHLISQSWWFWDWNKEPVELLLPVVATPTPPHSQSPAPPSSLNPTLFPSIFIHPSSSILDELEALILSRSIVLALQVFTSWSQYLI